MELDKILKEAENRIGLALKACANGDLAEILSHLAYTAVRVEQAIQKIVKEKMIGWGSAGD